jgi:hypothetical protein
LPNWLRGGSSSALDHHDRFPRLAATGPKAQVPI